MTCESIHFGGGGGRLLLISIYIFLQIAFCGLNFKLWEMVEQTHRDRHGSVKLTVPFHSIRPSPVPGSGGLDEIGSMSPVPCPLSSAHVADTVKINNFRKNSL